MELLLKKSSLMCGDDKKAEELSIWMVPRRAGRRANTLRAHLRMGLRMGLGGRLEDFRL